MCQHNLPRSLFALLALTLPAAAQVTTTSSALPDTSRAGTRSEATTVRPEARFLRGLQPLLGPEQVDGVLGVASAMPLSFVSTVDTATTPIVAYDFTLERPVDMTNVRAVIAETFVVDFDSASSHSFEVYFTLTSLGVSVLETNATFQSNNPTGDLYSIARLIPSASQVPALAGIAIDGAQIRIEFSGSAVVDLDIRSIAPDGRLELHFASCEIDGCGPHRTVDLAGIPGTMTGSFSGSCFSPCPWQPEQRPSFGVASGDLDADGDIDLVIGTERSGYLYFGIGDGRFGSGPMPPSDRKSADVALLDLEGDGDLDVIIAAVDGALRALVNDGQGRLVEDPSRVPSASRRHECLVAADFDGDGHTDLFVGVDGVNRLLRADGLGNLIELSGALPAESAFTRGADAGDVDMDGHLDLVLANGNGTDRLYLNDGTGHFSEAVGALPPDSTHSRAVVFADLDGDGDLDIAFGVDVSNARILLNDGTGAFNDLAGAIPSAQAGTVNGIAASDVDGDGDIDLFLGKASLVVLRRQNLLLLNDGTGRFALASSQIPVATESNTRAVALVDVDGDGDVDAISINAELNEVWLNDGTGHFTTSPDALPEGEGMYRFLEPIRGDELAVIAVGGFIWNLPNRFLRSTIEVQLRVSDGTWLQLDDWNSPSLQSPPLGRSVVGSLMLALDPAQRAALAGRWITGWRWRANTDPSVGGFAGISVGTGQNPAKFSFLYDRRGCAGQSAPTLIGLAPPPGSAVAAPGPLVISGTVDAPSSGLRDTFVTVDGVPVASLDAAGRFFAPVEVAVGANMFTLGGVLGGCGESATVVEYEGLPPNELAQLGFGDVSTSITPHYSATTWIQALGQLVFEVQPCNTGAWPLPEGIRMVVHRTGHPTLHLAQPDGYTAAGEPYIWFGDVGGDGRLAPGECAGSRLVAFANPLGETLDFDVRWEAPQNAAPTFVSAPPLSAFTAELYRYEAAAMDANGHALTFALTIAPAGMTCDPLTGVVEWIPSASDEGLAEVELRVTDTFGAFATQRYTLTVGGAGSNRAPYFVSSPGTQAGVAVPYQYAARAIDPDGDSVVYSLRAAPSGMVADSLTGVVDWPFPLNGLHPVAVVAEDLRGAEVVQEFVVAAGVISPNPTIPTLFGSPSGVAAVGEDYLYQPIVGNLDPGEVATFSLATGAPTGMSIGPASGRVHWRPSVPQLGLHSAELSVDDGRGGRVSQAWQIEVFSSLPNRPPVILSVPELVAQVGVPYHYQVQASDPEASVLFHALVSAPSGMWIDAATGLLRWDVPELGPWTVAIQVTDAGGLYGAQVYTLDVHPTNAPPSITSAPPTAVGVTGALYQHQVTATDPEGQELVFTLVEPPSGMGIHPQTGLLSWVPSALQHGVQPVTVRVRDELDAEDRQSFDLRIARDLVPPTVTLTLSQTQVVPGASVQACVLAFDDVAIAVRRLTVNGVPISLDPGSCAIVPLLTPGQVVFRAEAIDGGGNVAFDERVVSVNPDPMAPYVVAESIHPAPESVLTAPTPIRATIIDPDDPTTVTWEVRLALAGTGDFRVIGSGVGNQTNADVAVLDPTLMENGSYDIQIEANDGAQTGGVQYRYHVAGALKLGNLEYEVLDFSIPLQDVPITIARRYSSIATNSSDFGPGWTLQLVGRVQDSVRDADPAQGGLANVFSAEPYTASTRVYLTLPDGQRVGFTFRPTGAGFSFLARPAFEPDPGVLGELRAIGSEVIWQFGGRFYDFIIPYNPTEFVYRDENGQEYTVSEVHGLQRIVGVYGDVLEVTADYITSSSGIQIDFVRDSAGRILSITQPNATSGAAARVDYQYDALGRLSGVRFEGDSGNAWDYIYAANSNLLQRVVDSDGVTLLEAAFGLDERLTQICSSPSQGVAATCSTVAVDLAARSETYLGPDGTSFRYIHDERGNVVEEIVTLVTGQVLQTTRQYDDGMLTRETLPDGSSRTLAYEGRLLREETDFDGGVRVLEYGQCDKPVAITDPFGARTEYVYDTECRLIRVLLSDGSSRELGYGPNGRVERFVDASGARWEFLIGPFGIEERTNPFGGIERSTFDQRGRVMTQVNEVGQRIDFTYDHRDRLISEVWNNDPATAHTLQYTEAGKPMAVHAPGVSLERTYWSSGQLRTETWSGPQVPSGLSWNSIPLPGMSAFDANGRGVLIVDGLGGRDHLVRDGIGRITRIEHRSSASPGGPAASWDFVYGSNRLPTRVTFANASGVPVAVADNQLGCSCGANLQRVTVSRFGSGAILHDSRFRYDQGGRRTERQSTSGDSVGIRDAVGRLRAAVHATAPPVLETFEYEAGGLLAATSASGTIVYDSFPSGGRLPAFDALRAYEHDLAGRLTAIVDQQTGERVELAWDPRDRLVQTTTRDGAGIVLRSEEHGYDGLDRRVRSAVAGGATRWFAYHAFTRLFELDGTGALVRREILGDGLDAIVGELRPLDGVRWHVRDPQQDLLAELDDMGNVMSEPVWRVFGTRADSGPSPSTDLGWRGRPTLLDGLLIDFRWRHLVPPLGRFASVDPLYPHRYEFAESDPWSRNDPFGLLSAETRTLLCATVGYIGEVTRFYARAAIVLGANLLAVVYFAGEGEAQEFFQGVGEALAAGGVLGESLAFGLIGISAACESASPGN